MKCEESDSTLRMYILKRDPTNNKVKMIKQEVEYNHLTIKPEITIVEDEDDDNDNDPLNENFYDDNKSIDDVTTYTQPISYNHDHQLTQGQIHQQQQQQPHQQQQKVKQSPLSSSKEDKSVYLSNDNDSQDDNCDDNDLRDDNEYSEENIDYKAARNNEGRYSCHICSKTLADAKGLKLHIRLHTGQNLKRCNICNRGFAKKNHLTRHMDTHKEKIIQCTHCEEICTSNHELKLHLTAHNISR